MILKNVYLLLNILKKMIHTKKGDEMIAFISSLIMYIFFITTGVIFCFIGKDAYITVFIYMIFLVIIKPLYLKINCQPLEKKDFIFTGIICVIQLFLVKELKPYDKTDTYFYLYLSTFLPYISYVSSFRYKSLK